jgi:hypothetical protein
MPQQTHTHAHAHPEHARTQHATGCTAALTRGTSAWWRPWRATCCARSSWPHTGRAPRTRWRPSSGTTAHSCSAAATAALQAPATHTQPQAVAWAGPQTLAVPATVRALGGRSGLCCPTWLTLSASRALRPTSALSGAACWRPPSGTSSQACWGGGGGCRGGAACGGERRLLWRQRCLHSRTHSRARALCPPPPCLPQV